MDSNLGVIHRLSDEDITPSSTSQGEEEDQHVHPMLMVTNYYYKPSMKHEKGHILTSKHRIRV
jgi:hypothetical protein